jgi:hypothetical protein
MKTTMYLNDAQSPAFVSPGHDQFFDHSVFDDHQPHHPMQDFAGMGMEMADFQLDPNLDSHFTSYQDDDHSEFHHTVSNIAANAVGADSTPPSGGHHGMNMGMHMGMGMTRSPGGLFDPLHFGDAHQHLMHHRHPHAPHPSMHMDHHGMQHHHMTHHHLAFPIFNTVDQYVATHAGGAKEIAAAAQHGHFAPGGPRGGGGGHWDLGRLEDFQPDFPAEAVTARTHKPKSKSKSGSTTKKKKGSKIKLGSSTSTKKTKTGRKRGTALAGMDVDEPIVKVESKTTTTAPKKKAATPRHKKQPSESERDRATAATSTSSGVTTPSSKKRQKLFQPASSQMSKGKAASVPSNTQHAPATAVGSNKNNLVHKSTKAGKKLTIDTIASAGMPHVLGGHFVATPGSTCSGFSASCSTPGADGHKPKQTSYFRGVSCCGKDRKWQARIRDANRVRYLGRYATEVDAALVYDKAARECKGATAPTNFTLLDHETVDRLKKAFVQCGEVPVHMHDLLAKSMRPRVENAMKRKAAAALVNRNASASNAQSIHGGMGLMRGGLKTGESGRMADPLAVAAAAAAHAFNEAARLNNTNNNTGSGVSNCYKIGGAVKANASASAGHAIRSVPVSSSNATMSTANANKGVNRLIKHHATDLVTPHVTKSANKPFFPPSTPTGTRMNTTAIPAITSTFTPATTTSTNNNNNNVSSRLQLQSKAAALKSALQTKPTTTIPGGERQFQPATSKATPTPLRVSAQATAPTSTGAVSLTTTTTAPSPPPAVATLQQQPSIKAPAVEITAVGKSAGLMSRVSVGTVGVPTLVMTSAGTTNDANGRPHSTMASPV